MEVRAQGRRQAVTRSQHFSFEFYPPKTEKGRAVLRATLERLAPLGPEYVSVTFGAGGGVREHTLETVDLIRSETGLDAVPHLSCVGSSRDDIRAWLERYRERGVKRLFCLRGDRPRDGGSEAFRDDGFRHASELVTFARDFGDFEIHVACYPEFHPEAPDPVTDIEHFVQKVACGADVAVTQYFFSNAAYYHFVDAIRRRGVDVPVVVGLMPIVDFAQIDRFSSVCGADIPLWIRKRMEALKDDPAGQLELGVEIATRQAEDLLRNGAPGIHFYTLNRAEATARIFENLGLAGSVASAASGR
jgi:methylenetetrahydrofolate reductase (NADPH)